MQHTKTPWRLSTDSVRAPMATILADEAIPEVRGSDYTDCDGGHLVAESIAPRNAEFIVRACNAHDQLVAVLQDVVRPYGIGDVAVSETMGKAVQGDFLEVLRRARAALAAAGAA